MFGPGKAGETDVLEEGEKIFEGFGEISINVFDLNFCFLGYDDLVCLLLCENTVF